MEILTEHMVDLKPFSDLSTPIEIKMRKSSVILIVVESHN